MKITKIIFNSLVIIMLLLTSFTDQVYSQDKTITKYAPFQANAGDVVGITLQVEGGSSEFRRSADTMLAIDVTSSMSAPFGDGGSPPSKFYAAQTALKLFVDQTKEDQGVSNPGDFVGLVSYSGSLPGGAVLNFQVTNMYDGNPPPEPNNKQAIKNSIDTLPRGTGTAIGAGLRLANQELLSGRGRNGVEKFVVLATDGRQNASPSPYENNIMQDTVLNKIAVFTVGIGGDVNSTEPAARCVGCPDPNRDGLTSGAELMRTIACETDQQRSNPTDNCRMVWDPNNDPSINDWDNPEHYFYAGDPGALNKVYQDIAMFITINTEYQILEKTNDVVFEKIIAASIEVTDCTTGNSWTDFVIIDEGEDSFVVRLRDVGPGDWVCVNFKAKIKDNVEGDYPVDDADETLGVVWNPSFACDLTTKEGVQGCIDQMQNLTPVPISNPIISVKSPFKPWLKTTGGDVGSIGNISMNRDPLSDPFPGYNADYLVIAGGDPSQISNFTSEKRWRVSSYGTLAYEPKPTPPSTSIYDAMWNRYSSRCGPMPVSGQTQGEIVTAASGGCKILKYNAAGNYVITTPDWSGSYTGNPAIMFISGDLVINDDFEISSGSGLIFVVGGDVIVNQDVNRIDGVFIFDGDFEDGIDDDQLVVNGALIGGFNNGTLSFQRDLDEDNADYPAEKIIYEPKYLWLFRDIIGESTTVFTEVAP